MKNIQTRVEEIIKRGPRTGELTMGLKGQGNLREAGLRELEAKWGKFIERENIEHAKVKSYRGSGKWTQKTYSLIVDASVITPAEAKKKGQ